MDNSKEFYFGGLPESLFGPMVAWLQGKITPGAAGVTPADVTALVNAFVSLTKSEHTAAVSTAQVPPIDAVFMALDIQAEFLKLQAAPSGPPLVAQATLLTTKLDTLANFWLGK